MTPITGIPPFRILFGEAQFRRLVEYVLDRYSADTRMQINPFVRERLIEPGLPHLADVERALNDGKINYDFLEASIRIILDNARTIALGLGRTAIGEDTTLESMKEDCPYLFWC
jgi:hypothetical protein